MLVIRGRLDARIKVKDFLRCVLENFRDSAISKKLPIRKAAYE